MAKDKHQPGDALSTTVTLNFRRDSSRSAFTLPTLRVVAGPDMLRFCSVYPDASVVIGRDASCDLTLMDASVSRRHAMVSSGPQGILTLQDLGSTNGTTHNGRPVHAPVRLSVGDHVETGGVTLRVDRLGLDELAHLARVVERLSLANKDPLTGLATRHYVKEELPALMLRFEHVKLPVTTVFFDVDHFKAVNDTFGHSVGDEVLRAGARLMVLSVRDSDTCVRYGGEEFFAVLPNCDEMGGWHTAERLRMAIAKHDWEHYAPGLRVTASLGVAQHRIGESLEEWLNRADKAMYHAKATGRNRTVRASEVGL